MHLHVHSEFSPLDGFGTPKQIAEKAVKLGNKFVCLTDHGNTYGWLPLYQACQELEIKPGFGVEGYIRWDGIAGFGLDDEKGKAKKKKKSSKEEEDENLFSDSFAAEIAESSGSGNEGIPHITLVAFNQVGKDNIATLMRTASEPSNRRRGRPTFTLSELKKHCSGLIVTTGCPTGIPSRLMAENNLKTQRKFPSTRGIDEASKFVKEIKSLEKLGAYPVVEIVAQPGFVPGEISWTPLLDFAESYNLPWILTSDSHFVNATDFPYQDLILRIATGNPYSEEKAIPIPAYQYLCSERELIDRAVDMGMDKWTAQEGVSNVKDLDGIIQPLAMPKGSFPKYIPVSKLPAMVELRTRCVRGVDSPERRERLEYELGVLEQKNVADYFLILSDLCNYIARKGHIALCRGSAGGSLVAYSCGISQTDPILYKLLFERFLDAEREDLPDIDLDFSPEARKLAVEYLSSRYHTSKLLALAMTTRKSAIIDAAHMCGIKRDELEAALSVCSDDLDDVKVLDALPSEIIALYQKYPQLALVERIVGIPRHPSKNAAGLLVSSEPLPIPLQYDSEGDLISTVDKTHVDGLGLMKADLLSVRALSVIEKTMAKVGMSLEELYEIGKNHPDTNTVIFEAMSLRPAGIFQLDGSVLPVLEQITARGKNIDYFAELVAASALCRPGAMHFVGKYAERKTFGDSVLDRTFGVIVYQEQIMELARRSGKLSPNKLRKAVSKSKSAEVKEMVSEAGGLGLTPELLENLLNAGKYSFNESHAATYSIVALWMAYLKYKYPIQFLESYLNVELAQSNPNISLVRRLINEEIVRQKEKGINVKVIPLGFRLKNAECEYIRYDGKSMLGSMLATGLGSRKFIAYNHANTDVRKAELDLAEKISMDYAICGGVGISCVQLLEVFPWIPVPQLDDVPLHTESARFAEGEAFLTEVHRNQQTKAMPYPTAGYTIESGLGLIHGKISGKNYVMYKRILDMVPGTKVYIEYSSTKSRGRVGLIEACA